MTTKTRYITEEEENTSSLRLCECCQVMVSESAEQQEADDENCLCVVGACACPCAGYAWNYAVAVQREDEWCSWFLPCCMHFVLDGAVSGLAAHFSGIPYLMLPVGTILRVMQRRVVEKKEESLTTSCVEELFCWGCSIGEMNRRLRKRERAHLPPYGVGLALLGTLSEPPAAANSQTDLEL